MNQDSGNRSNTYETAWVRRVLPLVTVFIASVAMPVAHAALIAGATVIEWSSERNGPFGQDRRAIHLTDGSGLNVNGPGTHTTIPDGFMWLGENEQPGGLAVASQWLKFDLGSAQGAVDLRIWNYNEPTGSRGVRNLNILTNATNDPNLANWTNLGAFTFAQAPANATVDFSETFLLDPLNPFRYVYFDINTNWGDNFVNGFVGLSEVQFSTAPDAPPGAAPEPHTITLMLAGLGLLLSVTSLRSKKSH